MALAVWQSTIVNRSGDVQPNAQVEVRLESSGALAAIYADRDGTTPLSNPFNADENGFARFYAAGGAYRIDATLGGSTTTYRHQSVGLLAEQDVTQDDQLYYRRTAAEIAAGVTPTNYFASPFPYDVRRVGIVPNSSGAASANTTAAIALFSPDVTGPTGKFIFPNTTGADTYYFNGIIPIRDGVDIDLNGCTLNFSKTYESSDDASGFIYAVNKFGLRNGTIVIDYDGSGGTNAGYAIRIGNRGNDGDYFQGSWDSDFDEPRGDIEIRNIKINSNNPGSRAIVLIGGLQNVLIEDVTIHGNDVLSGGIYYEFGWATDEATASDRQTSHAYNLCFRNITVEDIDTDSSYGFGVGVRGAYNVTVDGLYVRNAVGAFDGSPGEAAFYNPWNPRDLAGAKSNVILRNVVGSGLTGVGLSLAGTVTTGYLASVLTDAQKVDLADYTLENVVIEGESGSTWGIQNSARVLTLRNVRITGFDRGVFSAGDGIHHNFDGLYVYNCKREAVLVSDSTAVLSPVRHKVVSIRNGRFEGNGADAGGANPQSAIRLDTCQGEIAYNIFGSDTEATQLTSVRLDSGCTHVFVHNNNTVGLASGGTAYVHGSSSNSQANTLQDNKGDVTSSGAWQVPVISRVASSLTIINLPFALSDYANDAAAASGGISVRGLYRNGSVVMTRVS